MRRNLVVHIGISAIASKRVGDILDFLDDKGLGLRQDEYDILRFDPFDGYFQCSDVQEEILACEASEMFTSQLLSIEKRGKHMYMIMESVDGRLAMALKRAIDNTKWNTRVIVSYIRLHEWLYQSYASQNFFQIFDQLEEWPEDGGRSIPSFLPWYSGYTTGWNTSNVGNHHLSIHLMHRYASVFENVVLDDPYSYSNPIQNIVCNDIPGAIQACNSFNNTDTLESFQEDDEAKFAALMIEAEILAMAARQKDLVRKDLSRIDVVVAIVQRIENEGVILSRSCHPHETEQLYEWVIECEKVAFGTEWRPKRISTISDAFHQFLTSGKLCDVDVETTLQDDDWIRFFHSL
jgi:hypothetical protein